MEEGMKTQPVNVSMSIVNDHFKLQSMAPYNHPRGMPEAKINRPSPNDMMSNRVYFLNLNPVISRGIPYTCRCNAYN